MHFDGFLGRVLPQDTSTGISGSIFTLPFERWHRQEPEPNAAVEITAAAPVVTNSSTTPYGTLFRKGAVLK